MCSKPVKCEPEPIKKSRLIGRRIVKSLLWLLLIGALLFAGGTIYWNWYLPNYIAERVLPPLGDQLGLDKMELNIRRIGFSGLDIATFTLIGEDGKKLSFDSIRADYTPHLPFKTPRALDITNLTFSGGDIHIAVKDKKFALSGCDVERVLERITALAADNASRKKTVVLEKITLSSLRLHLDYEGESLSVPTRGVITSDNNDWEVVHAQFTLTPRGQSLQFSVDYDTIGKSAKVNVKAEFRPESLSELLGFSIRGDAKTELNAVLSLVNDNINAVGSIDTELTLEPLSGLPVDFNTPVKLHHEWSLRYRTKEKELLTILNGTMEPNTLTFDSGAVSAKIADTTRWNFTFSNTPDTGFRVTEAGFSTGQVQFNAHGYTLNAPQLRLEEHDGRYLISGTGMRMVNPALKLNAGAIDLLIPLPATDKLPATLNAGNISYNNQNLGELRSTFYTQNHCLLLAGEFKNKFAPDARIIFNGAVSPRPGEMPDMLFEVNVPPWSPKQPIKLAQFRPSLGNATLSGILSVNGSAQVKAGKLSTEIGILLEDGIYDCPDLNLKAEGIHFDLQFEDLLSGKTLDGQSLNIAKISAGNLVFTDLQLLFDVASSQQANLERASVNWCGGKLILHSVRLNPSDLIIDTDIYCENLSLAELIGQLGLGKAKGNGVLFGKIPVYFSAKKGISFDSCYLFTRPGEENFIKLTDPEQIANGMAHEMLKQSQLDFALEALKDFNYSWAKLNFTTRGNEVLLSLQFDGKPNQPLPFSYNEKSGQLSRDPNGRALFEGIRLDINTRLPLNWLLQINQKFRELNNSGEDTAQMEDE
ncbi:MAG: YdbH domain-containing protein [Victivallales bacterium]|jgi:hypothetical protein|nr:YdbH domain-containing protein [Victivallales bacterium]